MTENRYIGWDIAAGLAAGAAATWIMGRVTAYLYEHEGEDARRRYEEVTDGKSVPDQSAEKLESVRPTPEDSSGIWFSASSSTPPSTWSTGSRSRPRRPQPNGPWRRPRVINA